MKEVDAKERSILNELMHINRDGFLGYIEAANDLDNKDLQQLLRKKALERNEFAFNLRHEALKRAYKLPSEDSFWGKMHRSWMMFRHRMNPHQDQVMLSECRRGEEHALKVYQDVFENHILSDLQPNLERQFVNIIEMRDMLRQECYPNENRPECGSVLHLSN